MKFNLHLNIPKKIQVKEVGPFLTLLFLVLILFLGFWTYTRLFVRIFRQPEAEAPSNIVRVDLRSYQDTVRLIKDLESYIPPTPDIKNNNPFQ